MRAFLVTHFGVIISKVFVIESLQSTANLISNIYNKSNLTKNSLSPSLGSKAISKTGGTGTKILFFATIVVVGNIDPPAKESSTSNTMIQVLSL